MVYKKIQLPFKVKYPVLALGSQTKNTICFAKNNTACVSCEHKDLSSPSDLKNFEKDARVLLRNKPKVIAYDLHPEYQSTKFGLSLSPEKYRLVPVQHHHAHIAGCMAENGIKSGKVIGVAFDGTGLGADNHIWGAEFLICGYKSFERRGHLKEIPLLGAERAILEPWRIAAFWLQGRLPGIDKKKWIILKKMAEKKINSPAASSMGRLFDAAGSLILNRKQAQFEAELAIALEKISAPAQSVRRNYEFKISKEDAVYVVDPGPIFTAISRDLKAGKPLGGVAFCFHATVARIILDICLRLRRETGITKVALSGGVFQNRVLLKLASEILYGKGFKVLLHRNLSANDSGISLGQAVIAGF